jgi:molybdate transport system ATP-binding protein
LLVLNEPFQALDERFIRKVRQWLDARLRPDQTLIFVSHYRKEMPRTVDRVLQLDAGRIVKMR